MTGFVYAIQSGALVKIGWSKDPVRRMAKIASDCPEGAALLGAMPGTRDDEAELHRDLSVLRFRGEWFHFDHRLRELVRQWPAFVSTRRRQSNTNPRARQKIIDARTKSGLSQDEIAQKCGVTRWTINRVESGDRDPSLALMHRIVDVLDGISLDDFSSVSNNRDFLPTPTPAPSDEPNVAPKQCEVAE